MAITPVNTIPHNLVFFEMCRFIGIIMALEYKEDINVMLQVRCTYAGYREISRWTLLISQVKVEETYSIMKRESIGHVM